MAGGSKQIIFWADSRDRLRSFPEEARMDLGHGLHLVEQGKEPPHFDHLPELGSGVMEVKVDHDKETYRAFYVAKFAEAIYVLDAIHKKSKKGKELPKPDKERIQKRYKEVVEHRKALKLS
jgi:phage-related protein